VFDARLGKEILFSTASRPALVPTQPPLQWVPVCISTGVKRQERKADRSPPSNAEVEKDEAISPSPVRLYGVMLN
jgi:hypothetical protein